MANSSSPDLARKDFDADRYVRNRLKNGDGYEELEKERRRIKKLSDETAFSLKKNVYKNYAQFIETSKEISYMEGEMYQLSHILGEQKNIMTQMLGMKITANDDVIKERELTPAQKAEIEQKSLTSLLERVEGSTHIAEVPGRYLIHDGELVELDTDSFSEVQRIRAFLLNDSMMVATPIQRRGPARYKFQALFELDNIAVVNVRDVGTVKNAFKLLMFPEQHMYQCEIPKDKRTWLEILEETKKNKAAQENENKRAIAEMLSEEFDTSDLVDSADVGETANASATSSDPLQAAWLIEAPEDLDISIAQRDFKGTVDLIEKCHEYMKELAKTPALKEMRARLDQRATQVTEVLVKELEANPDRTLRGGPKVTRRAVTQLIRLGNQRQACDLYLRNRSTALKLGMRRLRIEGSTTLYINKLCTIFFSHMVEDVKEFEISFEKHPSCFSTFVVWAKMEIQLFVNLFSRQAFASKASLSTAADCVCIARQQCDKLSTVGMEMTFAMDAMMRRPIIDMLEYNRNQIIEASKHRMTDEKWRPMNLSKPNLAQNLVQEMQRLGLTIIASHLYDKCWVNLSNSTVAFTKVFLGYFSDAVKLFTPELYPVTVECLADIFTHHLQLVKTAISSQRFEHQRAFIQQNVDFLFKSVLAYIENKLEEMARRDVKELSILHNIHKEINQSVALLGAYI